MCNTAMIYDMLKLGQSDYDNQIATFSHERFQMDCSPVDGKAKGNGIYAFTQLKQVNHSGFVSRQFVITAQIPTPFNFPSNGDQSIWFIMEKNC